MASGSHEKYWTFRGKFCHSPETDTQQQLEPDFELGSSNWNEMFGHWISVGVFCGLQTSWGLATSQRKSYIQLQNWLFYPCYLKDQLVGTGTSTQPAPAFAFAPVNPIRPFPIRTTHG
jgi:hypothetical protein